MITEYLGQLWMMCPVAYRDNEDYIIVELSNRSGAMILVEINRIVRTGEVKYSPAEYLNQTVFLEEEMNNG